MLQIFVCQHFSEMYQHFLSTFFGSVATFFRQHFSEVSLVFFIKIFGSLANIFLVNIFRKCYKLLQHFFDQHFLFFFQQFFIVFS
jgi:DNA-binding FadR family transcriptional regulator